LACGAVQIRRRPGWKKVACWQLYNVPPSFGFYCSRLHFFYLLYFEILLFRDFIFRNLIFRFFFQTFIFSKFYLSRFFFDLFAFENFSFEIWSVIPDFLSIEIMLSFISDNCTFYTHSDVDVCFSCRMNTFKISRMKFPSDCNKQQTRVNGTDSSVK
jgi:hypothetical protein